MVQDIKDLKPLPKDKNGNMINPFEKKTIWQRVLNGLAGFSDSLKTAVEKYR